MSEIIYNKEDNNNRYKNEIVCINKNVFCVQHRKHKDKLSTYLWVQDIVQEKEKAFAG